MGTIKEFLPAAILSVLTANPMLLASAVVGKGVAKATGSEVAGKVASIATGGIDPATLLPAIAKEGALTAIEQAGPEGQMLSTGIRAGTSFAGAKEAIGKPSGGAPATEGPSTFEKALPYAALLAPAAISLARTGKVMPGLQVGNQMLQGISAIKNMEINKAREKDRVEKSAIEIDELKKQQKILDTETDPFMSPEFLRASPGVQEVMKSVYSPHLNENGKMTVRRFEQVKNDAYRRTDIVEQATKANTMHYKNMAVSAFDKAQKIAEKSGRESPEYQAAYKEYERTRQSYEERSAKGESLLATVRRREELAGQFKSAKGKEFGDTKKIAELYGEEEAGKFAAQKTGAAKRSWKVVPDENSSTGFSYKDLESKEIGGEAPKPSSLVNINMPKPASASERTAIAEGEATIDTLNNLQSLYDQAFVGPLAGRVGAVKDLFGGNAQARSEFIAATSAFKNKIIKEITGAAMGEEEAKRIMKQIPDVNNPPSVWQARWNQSLKNVEFLQIRRNEILRKSGIKAPGSEAENLGDKPKTAEAFLKKKGM